jgi:ornithine carbamoyltransferase
MRTLVSIAELTPDELERLVRRTAEVAENGPTNDALAGRLVAICADHAAQPDWLAMWCAATRLGAHVVVCGPAGLPLGAAAAANGSMLGEYLDAVIMTVDADIGDIFRLRADDDLAVIAARSSEERPIQAVASLTALYESFRRLAGRHLLCVGGGATATSLALAGALVPGFSVTLLASPAAELACAFGTTIRVAGSPAEVDRSVDAVHLPAGFDVALVAPLTHPETVVFHEPSPGVDALPVRRWERGPGGRCGCSRRARYAMAAATAVLQWCVTG